jgi:hypothetical protein
MMEKPDVSWKYIGEELALFWINPWSKQEEKIATFWWPAHPVEDTAMVEKWFEEYAQEFIEKANDCAFDCQFEGRHPGCKKHNPKDKEDSE